MNRAYNLNFRVAINVAYMGIIVFIPMYANCLVYKIFSRIFHTAKIQNKCRRNNKYNVKDT